MNIIVLYIQKGCEILNERGVVLVHQTSNEIRPWGIAWNHSSNAHDTIDTGLIEVCLIVSQDLQTIHQKLAKIKKY